MKNAAAEFLQNLLSRALLENASDIHLEPFENHFQARLRTPSGLKSLPTPNKEVFASLSRHLKLLAKLDIAIENLPQDGKFSLNLGEGDTEFRLATLPTLFGESFVLRVLDRRATPLELDSLGFSSEIVEQLKEALKLPFGLIAVVGSTGSGKTTTLYACLRYLLERHLKIVSIEDPIEYALTGVQQAAVSAHLDFPTALRAFLRHDPDVIFVGEIRDSATAKLAIQAALTGHLVLATLHTSSAHQTFNRLADLGVSPSLIEGALKFILCQKLEVSPENRRRASGEALFYNFAQKAPSHEYA